MKRGSRDRRRRRGSWRRTSGPRNTIRAAWNTRSRFKAVQVAEITSRSSTRPGGVGPRVGHPESNPAVDFFNKIGPCGRSAFARGMGHLAPFRPLADSSRAVSGGPISDISLLQADEVGKLELSISASPATQNCDTARGLAPARITIQRFVITTSRYSLGKTMVSSLALFRRTAT